MHAIFLFVVYLLIFENQILAKDSNGRLRPWNPPGQKWSDGSVFSDLPMQRLAELFNVNNFIVSQVECVFVDGMCVLCVMARCLVTG